jgi:hypothetical protein
MAKLLLFDNIDKHYNNRETLKMKILNNILMGIILAALTVPAMAASAVAPVSKYMSFDEFVAKNMIPIPAVFPEEAGANRIFSKQDIRARKIALLNIDNAGRKFNIQRCVVYNAKVIARNYDLQHGINSLLTRKSPPKSINVCKTEDPLMQKAMSTIKILSLPDFPLNIDPILSERQKQSEIARYTKIFNEAQQ